MTTERKPRRPLTVHLPRAVKTPLEKLALRALRQATHLFGLMLAERLRELRDSGDPLQIAHAQALEKDSLARVLEHTIHVIGARWDKLPDKRRPHYTPGQRADILRVKHVLDLSRKETAKTFRVSPDTVAEWERQATGEPDKDTIGNTVKPTPPVRRYADVVQHMVQWMTFMGFGGDQRIAQTLARAGWKIGHTTAGRYKKKPFVPLPPASQPVTRKPLQAWYPHHVWVMDVTRVPALMGAAEIAVAAVFDAFSRVPLAVRTFDAYPLAKDTLALVQDAVRSFGKPKYIATDRGEEFDAAEFTNAIKALGIKHRFDSVGKHSITARLERFWRTLKLLTNVTLQRPLLRQDLDRRLHVALDYYAHARPHQGLGGATPAEILRGLPPAHLAAIQPPRGRAGEGPHELPFRIEFADPEEQLPILTQVA